MAPERRRQLLLLAALVAVIALVAYAEWPRPSSPASPASNGRGAAGSMAQAAPAADPPTVHLPALGAERPKPGPASRNPFRFKPKPPPPTPQPTLVQPTTPVPTPTGPPTPPPPPPITLKYIGYFDQGGKKIAGLSDSIGHVDWGSEGETIAGRYRIQRIGVESLEISYIDGTGRRTIPLAGK
jgi:hypothetical protein